jgi:hypothetical protein
MSFTGEERRKSTRYQHSSRLDFHSISSTQDITYSGVSVDISSAGIGLYTCSTAPNEGDEIAFEDALPVSYQKAIVRWVERYTENCYGVGVRFFKLPWATRLL